MVAVVALVAAGPLISDFYRHHAIYPLDVYWMKRRWAFHSRNATKDEQSRGLTLGGHDGHWIPPIFIWICCDALASAERVSRSDQIRLDLDEMKWKQIMFDFKMRKNREI